MFKTHNYMLFANFMNSIFIGLIADLSVLYKGKMILIKTTKNSNVLCKLKKNEKSLTVSPIPVI